MVNFGRKDVGMITLLKVSLMGWNRRKLVLLSLGGQEETTHNIKVTEGRPAVRWSFEELKIAGWDVK